MSTSDDENNGNNDSNGSASQANRDWPQTVDEAVDRLLAGLSDKDKETVRSTQKENLIQFHFGWGMGIRNAFGMWQGNAALLKSCAEAQYGPGSDAMFMHPDDASGVIIEAVWQRLQDDSAR